MTPSGKLGLHDVKKIAKGALIAGVGAAAVVVASWSRAEQFDWRVPAIAFATAACSVVANAVRKLAIDTRS